MISVDTNILVRYAVKDDPIQTLTWFEQGLDFADALHLASSSLPDGLATMDRRLFAKAEQIGCDRRITVVG
jgi:predicted nucleic-acid-binding protein